METTSRRKTRLHPLERLSKTVRRLPILQSNTKIWNILRPVYNRLADQIYPQGIAWMINGTDQLLLSPHMRAVSENHEPHVWRKLGDGIRPVDVFADVGAASGIYTLMLMKRSGSLGRAIAFEPDPANYKLLCQNIRLNNMENQVQAVNAAVAAQNGKVTFSSGFGARSHITSGNGINVDCVTLDQFFVDSKLDVIKIDVEGYEEDVLKGASILLRDTRRRPRMMYIELHPHFWQKRGLSTTLSSLIALLEDYGYNIRDEQDQLVDVQNTYWGLFATTQS